MLYMNSKNYSIANVIKTDNNVSKRFFCPEGWVT